MKVLVVALLSLAAVAQAVSFFEVVVEEWEGWKLVHREYLQVIVKILSSIVLHSQKRTTLRWKKRSFE